VPAAESGYLQAVDASSLFSLGEGKHLVIRMECQIGEYVLRGQRLATVWPAEKCDEAVVRGIRTAFDQIRHFGADNPTIVKKLLDALASAGDCRDRTGISWYLDCRWPCRRGPSELPGLPRDRSPDQTPGTTDPLEPSPSTAAIRRARKGRIAQWKTSRLGSRRNTR
jgi:hypothetical protein